VSIDGKDIAIEVFLGGDYKVAQLVEYQAVMREVVSLTPAGPPLRVLN